MEVEVSTTRTAAVRVDRRGMKMRERDDGRCISVCVGTGVGLRAVGGVMKEERRN